jgi:hypothetical protein
VLEGLCLDDTPHEMPISHFFGKVYRWCHITSDSCGSPHSDWIEDFLAAEVEIHKTFMSPEEKRRASPQTGDET